MSLAPNPLDHFISHANQYLLSYDEGLSYLAGRGVVESQIVSHVLGAIEEDYHPILENDPKHGEDCGESFKCDSCGLYQWIKSHNYHKQKAGSKSGSVVFPLTGPTGRVYGVQSRSIDKKVFDTFLLSRRPEPVFFGTSVSMQEIWSSGVVVLTEGPADMLVVERCYKGGVLALTTNQLNANQTKFISRYCTTVISILDADEAGRNGFKSLHRKFSSTHNVVDVRLTGQKAKDPNDLWKLLGDEKFSNLLEQISGFPGRRSRK